VSKSSQREHAIYAKIQRDVGEDPENNCRKNCRKNIPDPECSQACSKVSTAGPESARSEKDKLS
jgi:hypothetical protein